MIQRFIVLFATFFMWHASLEAKNRVDERFAPYKNPKLSHEERVRDLLGRMTLDEKLGQIIHLHSWRILDGQTLDESKLRDWCGDVAYGFVDGFPLTSGSSEKYFRTIQRYMLEKTRLGIPCFNTGESLHGAVQEGATIYPQNLALGCTFNPELAYKKAAMTTQDLHYIGVNLVFAPCIDVVRELRWGRVEESYGEDPYLCGVMAVQEVRGYMDNGILPMAKHYGAHGNPTGGLNISSVHSSVSDLFDIYLKPFEMAIRDAELQAVMSSYNSWNRKPNSSSHYLMTDVLRDKFGFRGFVYSDWGAIEMLKTFHKTAASDQEAAIQALTAGLDVEASSDTYPTLKALVEQGGFDVAHIDLAVKRVLMAKMKLGLFEDPYREKYAKSKILHSPESVELSRRISEESVVLLKNEGKLLPLDMNKIKSLAVIGPNADQVQFGDYTWGKENTDGVTPLAGIKELVGDKMSIHYAEGCGIASLDETMIPQAVEAARKSDVALVFVGSSSTAFVRDKKQPSTSGEGIDLHDIALTGVQEKLVKAVCATGKPTVVILVAGKPFAIPWIKEHVPAIVAQYYGGEEEGRVIADVLFGRVNPSGKLTFSYPQSTGHLPAYYNHLPSDKGLYKQPGSYASPGRDYVFATPDALWLFGHGLSYTDFEYLSAVSDKRHYGLNDTINLSVSVKNTGQRSGKEVVQVYVRDVVSSLVTPVKELKGFSKLSIEAGKIATCHIRIPVSELRLTDDRGERFLETGLFELQVGTASDNIKHRIEIEVGDTQRSFESKTLIASEADAKSTKNIRITGEVRDLQGTPIAGVEVLSRDTKRKVRSDSKGFYRIDAGDRDLLMFSKKGFKTEKIEVGQRSGINVKMDYEN